jgi:5-formyltetrahydrofolate cyclo-ligase
MYGLKIAKTEIRETYLQKRRDMPAEEKRRKEELLCLHFLRSASYRYYDTLLMYSPKPEEIDITPIALKALSDGKRVAYPRCIAGSRLMDFHFVTSVDLPDQNGYGIKEPSADSPKYDPAESCCAVCLIPAIAFDRHGYRIGYGGGYYDRFLSRFKGALAGVIFSDFITDSLPHGKFDLRADTIFTEGGAVPVEKN